MRDAAGVAHPVAGGEPKTIFVLIGRLATMVVPYGPRALLVGVGLAFEMAFASALPFSFKFIIDDGLIGGDHALLMAIIIGLAVGGIVVSAIGLGRDFLFAQLAASALGDLRARLFAHLQRLALDFYARSRVGDVLGRFSNDLGSVETALANAIPWGILPALDVLANTALLMWLDWRLALVATLAGPLCLLGPRLFTARALEGSYARKLSEGEALSLVQENVQAQPMIKAFNLQSNAMREFGACNTILTARVRRVAFLSALVERSAGLGIMVLQVVVLAIGAWMVASGMMTVGTLTAFLALFLNASLSLAYTTQFVPTLVHAAGGLARIDELFAVAPGVLDRSDALELTPLSRRIAIENVSFGYTQAGLSLRGVSVDIPASASAAFVGASGSGKSTILNLLMRLYDPNSGRVTFDGIDLRTASQESLRRQIGIVFQESFLLNTTVAENIALGRPGASQAEIEAAARAAEIHEFITVLPDGYATVVGERGGRLSGGQRQRIAIARAVLRDPRILILDEATSALDPGTEAAISETLSRIGRGRTVVSVTHRLASVVGADCIHALDQGRVVESGRHADLLARRGHYARLWAKQSGFQLSQDGDVATVSPTRLREVPLFDQLDDATLDLAASLFVTERHPGGRTIIHQGDEADRFYILVRGTVEIFVTEADLSRGIAVREDGDHFGEIALLRAVPRTASVRSLTACTLLSLQRRQFDLLLRHAPQLRARMEAVHSARLTSSTA
jgi:ATP-binding cassette subfamily B protein